jgi:hypothetical protein
MKKLYQLYPHQYSFTNKEDITLCYVLELDELQDLFHLPLSEEAYAQFYELIIYLLAIQTTTNSD